MSALLLKDFYTLMRQMRIFLLLIVVFAVLPGFSMSSFAVVYAAMLPITALAYDERSKWDSLAAMMPYTPRQIVVSKYLLGYIGIIFAAILAFAAQSITAAVQNSAVSSSELLTLLLVTCVASIFFAASMPFMFKLGVEKGRILLFILVAAIAGSAMVGGDKLIGYIDTVQSETTRLLLFAIGGSILVNLISIALSIRFYKVKAK